MKAKFLGCLLVLFLFTNTSHARFFRRCGCVPQNFTPTVVVEAVVPIIPVVDAVFVPIIVPSAVFQYSPPPAIGAYPPPALLYAPTLANAGPPNAYTAPAAPAYGGAAYGYPGMSGPGYVSGGYGGTSPTFSGPYTSPYTSPPIQQPQQGFGQDQIRALTKAVVVELQRQSSSDDPGPPPVPGVAPPVGVQPYPSVAPPPGQPLFYPPTNAAPVSGKPLPTSPYAVSAIAALSRNCAYCHTGGGARGDTVIFSQPGILNPDAPFRSMERELQAGRMPPRVSQFRPAPEEYATVMAWLSGQ